MALKNNKTEKHKKGDTYFIIMRNNKDGIFGKTYWSESDAKTDLHFHNLTKTHHIESRRYGGK